MKLQLLTVKNVKYELECTDEDTVLQLKQMIETKLGLASAEELRLIYAGKLLKNENTIALYKIKPNDKIVIMISKKSESISTTDSAEVTSSSLPANDTSTTSAPLPPVSFMITDSSLIASLPTGYRMEQRPAVYGDANGIEIRMVPTIVPDTPATTSSSSLPSFSSLYHAGPNTRTSPEVPSSLTGRYSCKYIKQNAVYDGEWKDGKHHGNGKLGSDSEIYEGGWIQNKRHGHGTLTSATGCIYTGEWAHDEPHGHGIMKYPSGNCYDGRWENGKQNGQATFTYANGDIFRGIYRDNKMVRGIYTSRDGSVYDGEWENDQFHGTGTMSLADGTTYRGQFRFGKANGLGCMTFPNGNTNDGTWRDDRFIQGTVRNASTGISRTGTFIKIGNDNVLNGTVTVTQNDGTQYQTTYERGVEIARHTQQQNSTSQSAQIGQQAGQQPPEKIAQITALGFTYLQATQALAVCGGNVEMAANFLFQEGNAM